MESWIFADYVLNFITVYLLSCASTTDLIPRVNCFFENQRQFFEMWHDPPEISEKFPCLKGIKGQGRLSERSGGGLTLLALS